MKRQLDPDACLMGAFYACCPVLLACLIYFIAR